MILGTAKKQSDVENKPTRFYSENQENIVSKNLDGARTKNSGATDFGGKSDVLLENWAIECKTKTSDSESISIKKSWIEKLKQDSLFDNKEYHAIAFNFGPSSENYYIIDEKTFKELCISKG